MPSWRHPPPPPPHTPPRPHLTPPPPTGPQAGEHSPDQLYTAHRDYMIQRCKHAASLLFGNPDMAQVGGGGGVSCRPDGRQRPVAQTDTSASCGRASASVRTRVRCKDMTPPFVPLLLLVVQDGLSPLESAVRTLQGWSTQGLERLFVDLYQVGPGGGGGGTRGRPGAKAQHGREGRGM